MYVLNIDDAGHADFVGVHVSLGHMCADKSLVQSYHPDTQAHTHTADQLCYTATKALSNTGDGFGKKQ